LYLFLKSLGGPCDEITLGDCTIEEDNILEHHPYTEGLCHTLCEKSDDCEFWRHNEAPEDPNEACLFLKTDYHQVLIAASTNTVW
jgi:hypothetical protein